MLRYLRNSIVLLLAVAAVPACAMSIVAPGGSANVDGPGISDGPFVNPGSGGRRFQQIFDASLFSSVTGPQTITAIQFRAANTENAFRPNSVSASDTSISLSTTGVNSTPGATANGNFSAAFDANVGSDAQVVYSGQLTLDRGGSNPAGQPQPFEYGFTLQTAFVYDPANGNLLLDVIVPTFANVTQGPGFGRFESFDAVNADDGVASVTGLNGNAIGAATSTGLVTQFTLSPTAVVPEPSTWALVMVGGLGCLCFGRRRYILFAK